MFINVQINDADYALLLNGTSRMQGSIGLVSQPKVISMVIDAHARNRVRNTCASHMGR